jgi:hypothetical protein
MTVGRRDDVDHMDNDKHDLPDIGELLRVSSANVQRARLLLGVCENRCTQAQRLVDWARANINRIRSSRHGRAAKRAVTRVSATATRDGLWSESLDDGGAV